jgi:D-amino peptidase
MANKPERIFISIDMEGISSIVDWTHVDRDHAEYGYYRKMMAGDLNSAIEGALAAGVKEIVVNDSHGGMRNLQPGDVHEAAYLIRGSPKPNSMMEGIDDGHYDAALYVGYHSMVGTERGILAHTIAGSTVDGVIINGRETGEFGMNAALAGWHGVPSVFLAGDAAACAEAESFVSGVTTAPIKWAVGRYSAKCLHPNKSRELIKQKAKEALEDIGKVSPYWVNEPVEVKMRWVTPTMADVVSILPYMERIDGKMTSCTFDDYPSALRGLRASITMAGTAERR